jgi:tetratricopeptide (TPR) repeat protein
VGWARTHDREPRDLLALRAEIARDVVEALGVRPTASESARLARRPTTDPEAYELYARGRFHWVTRTEHGMETALGFYQQAVQRDPEYALAYVGIADAYVNLSNFGFEASADPLARARAAAERAVQLDPGSAEAQASLGFVLESQLAFADAEAAFQRAIAIDPRYVWARHYYALLLAMLGRVADARAQERVALAVDPLSLPANAHWGVLAYMDGDVATARRQLERTLLGAPSFPLALYYLGIGDAAQGRYADAIDRLGRARRVAPRFPGVLAALAFAQRGAGHGADAAATWAELRAQRGEDARGRANHALGLGVAGDLDGAFRELAHVEWDMPLLIELRADPLLARLRADPRYASLVAGIAHPR